MGTRKLVVEVVGDSRSLERAFSRSSTATTRFGRDVDTTAAKVDRSFTRMQRVMAGGFLGGAAATAGIAALRQVVNVASEAETVMGQTSVAVESAGISWEKYAQRIQTAITAQSRLGFDDEALLRTFSLFVRQAGSVDEALRRNAIAADVSRARFIDLEQAAQIVNKAALGQAGALRRLGIDAKTGATSVELLTQLEKQFGGAAAEASDSAAAASQRFHVAVENLQEQLGSGLADPVITGLADGTARFIDNLSGLADIKIPTIEIPFVTKDETPGRKRDRFTVTDLLGAGLRASRDLERGILGLEGEHRASPEAITAGAKAFDAIYQSAAEAFETGANQAAADAKPPSFGQPGFKVAANNLGKALQDAFDASLDSLDLKLDQASVTAGIADDLAVSDQIIAAIEKRIETQGHTTALERQLFQAKQERSRIIADHDAQQRQAAQAERDRRVRLAQDRARAAQEARDAATEARQERQFRALGLTPEGAQLTPGVPNLRKQFEQLSARDDFGDLTPKMEAKVLRAGKVISGAFGKVTEETRKAVAGIFDAARDVLNEESGKDLVPDIRSVTLSDRILAALGFGQEADAIGQLGVDKRRGTRGRNATTVSGPSAVNMYGPVTVVADNPDAFLRQLQKKAGRTTATSRGRFPGKSMGLS